MRFVLAVAVAVSSAVVPAGVSTQALSVPGGEAGIGYDDLELAPGLKRILVPGGRTGRLVLIDPATKALTSVDGFSAAGGAFHGGHGEGTTSAVEVPGTPARIVATDRGSGTLKVVDPAGQRILASVALAAPPDYVRAAGATGEIWVTEPRRKQIEVLKVADAAAGRLVHVANIPVPDGPESLVIDAEHGRAYSHTWTDQSYAIDMRERKVVATWRNGCLKSRGMALDARRGLLFAGCAEGKATVVDLATHQVTATAPAGPDIDSIGYGDTLGHLYVPSAESGDLSVFAVTPDRKLKLLAKVPTAPGVHTVAFDPTSKTLFLGAPEHGTVLVIRDQFQ